MSVAKVNAGRSEMSNSTAASSCINFHDVIFQHPHWTFCVACGQCRSCYTNGEFSAAQVLHIRRLSFFVGGTLWICIASDKKFRLPQSESTQFSVPFAHWTKRFCASTTHMAIGKMHVYERQRFISPEQHTWSSWFDDCNKIRKKGLSARIRF